MSYLSFEKLNQHLSSYDPQSSFFVVDKKVHELWGDRLTCLSDKKVYFVTDPEASKSYACVEEMVTFFLEKGVKRNSKVIAIGGGALSDLAGYCASIVLRGVSWEVVPTTLLSLIDASIGGKTGINTPFGKNTVGSFHRPVAEHLCLEFLNTLPLEEVLSGKGEALKYAFLNSSIGEMILNDSDMGDILHACRGHKEEVVKNDPLERGERAFLNLGHTFGHALERMLLMPHGLAVTTGIELVIRLFRPELLETFSKLKDKLGIEYGLPKGLNSTELFKLMLGDKKSEKDNEIVLIVPRTMGQVEKRCILVSELKEKLNEHCPSFLA